MSHKLSQSNTQKTKSVKKILRCSIVYENYQKIFLQLSPKNNEKE